MTSNRDPNGQAARLFIGSNKKTVHPMTDFLYNSIVEALQRGYVAAYRILGNAEESRDACQEAAARALAARDKYDPAQPFYPWFYRILKNHCLDRLRQRKHQPQEATVEPVAHDPSAESRLAAHEQHTAINRAITQLPEEMREIIELRHFQDLSYEEIADLLGCPVGTVMSRLYRARQTLRKVLQKESDFRFEAPNREKSQ
ncbi:MAG: RNA polymerase sigma factor [Myxococcales bacterium]|nr:RNA polymerase sigma factor [Myxococcales bacterium]